MKPIRLANNPKLLAYPIKYYK